MIKTAFLAALTFLTLVSSAEARPRHRTFVADPGCNVIFPCEGVSTSARGERVVRAMGGFGSAQKVYISHGSVVAHPAGCPARAFCGCGAAVRVFGRPVRELWLAANWFKFSIASPAHGMAGVRRHHVIVLESHVGGDIWLVYDPNSGGHATRIHEVDISRYTIVNPHGAG